MKFWIFLLMYVNCYTLSHTFISSGIRSGSPQQFLEPHLALARQKRYLLYPDGDPARVQLIIGLGVPLDLDDESVTIGYVIKILYHVPQVATDYSSHMYDSAASARGNDGYSSFNSTNHNKTMENRRRKDNPKFKAADKTYNETRSERHAKHFDDNIILKNGKKTNSDNSDGGILYSEGGVITDKENDGNYERYLMDAREKERREKLIKSTKTTRWDIYKILEHMMEENGYSGRACMLRSICEAAETPFTHKNGLLGELMHIILTPSTTAEVLSQHSDNEYHAAEKLGVEEISDCERIFHECLESPLELFSEIGLDTLLG